MQLTEATTTTFLSPLSRALVARRRRRSISSLIEASLAMYVSVEGTYASG